MKVYNYFKNMSQEFRFKNIHETRNYFFEKIEQRELIRRKPKMVCTTLNYIEYTLILILHLMDAFQFLLLLLCLVFL